MRSNGLQALVHSNLSCDLVDISSRKAERFGKRNGPVSLSVVQLCSLSLSLPFAVSGEQVGNSWFFCVSHSFKAPYLSYVKQMYDRQFRKPGFNFILQKYNRYRVGLKMLRISRIDWLGALGDSESKTGTADVKCGWDRDRWLRMFRGKDSRREDVRGL